MAERGKKRLPRNRRVPVDERPPMRLTDRDIQIIQAVNDYQVLTGDHIQALFFGSRSTAQYRLARLYQHEFLQRHFMTMVVPGPASSPILYTLDKRGVQVLTAIAGYERNQIRLPKRGGLSWKFVEHRLAVNDFRVALTLAVRANYWTLETWEDETVFRANPDYVVVTDGKGKKHQKPVLPDGYFRLLVPQGRTHCFVEIDRGTEPHHKFKPQVAVYQAYTASGQYQKRYSPHTMRVLVVTTTPRRLENLKETTHKAGGDRRYWFTTQDMIQPETVLTAPIWQRLGDTAVYPLIEPSDEF